MTFEIHGDEGRYSFKLTAQTGEVVLSSSKTYATKTSVKGAVRVVKSAAKAARVIDLTASPTSN